MKRNSHSPSSRELGLATQFLSTEMTTSMLCISFHLTYLAPPGRSLVARHKTRKASRHVSWHHAAGSAVELGPEPPESHTQIALSRSTCATALTQNEQTNQRRQSARGWHSCESVWQSRKERQSAGREEASRRVLLPISSPSQGSQQLPSKALGHLVRHSM